MYSKNVSEKVIKLLDDLRETNLYTPKEYFEVGLACENRYSIQLANNLILPAGSHGVINEVDNEEVSVVFKLSEKVCQDHSLSDRDYTITFKIEDYIKDFDTYGAKD